MNPRIRDFLAEVRRRGDLLGLETIRGLMKALGNPEKSLSVIQVAGTNGKGSVCCYLSHVLQSAGYCVGVFSSPAVFSEYERYAVNGEWITPENYDVVMETLLPVYRGMQEAKAPLPTIFEVETAAAVLYFIKRKCDICIFETGMGGDTDATNIFQHQLLAVFTSIGLDHMQFLGDTLEQIAGHKAGIMKRGGRALSAGQSEEVRRVLEEEAHKQGCSLTFVPSTALPFPISMTGAWQRQNAAVAYEALRQLGDLGYVLPGEAMEEGFRKARWPGRMERVAKQPPIYLDGAHNVPAFEVLARELSHNPLFAGKRIWLILGVLADKAVEEMLSAILPVVSGVVCISGEGTRGLSAEDLSKLVEKTGFPWFERAGEYRKALDLALSYAPDVVVCTGSLTILRGMREAILKKT